MNIKIGNNSKETGFAVEVKINIKSTVFDLELAQKMNEHENNTDCSEKIEYTVEGTYIEDGSRIKITYQEPAETGADNTVTVLIFDTDNRDALTMVRSGDLSASFRFDMNEKRQLCSYETPFMPMEFFLNTRKVANNVKNGKGAILLDYCIEVRGVNAERNRVFIEVRPL